jgi:hypothetical protein
MHRSWTIGLALVGGALAVGCTAVLGATDVPTVIDGSVDGDGGDGSTASSSDSGGDAKPDATTGDGATTPVEDSGGDTDSASDSGSPSDAGSGGDTGSADKDSGQDAGSSNACTTWLVPPAVDPTLNLPEGGVVLLHAAGTGTQNYACVMGGGTTSWVLLGPNADLNDCQGALIGHHFTSDGGTSAYPEWQTTDGTYVIGHKVTAFTPEGGSGSIPWLLLQAVNVGGAGTLSHVAYIQRVDTAGGLAVGVCDAGATVQVPYTADYFFYGN